MNEALELPFDLLIATLSGLAVGSEREWSGKVTGPDARFAGLRTFAIIGGLGGIAGLLLRQGLVAPAVVVIAALLLFPIVAYAVAVSRQGTTTDGTTEVAALAVTALGVLAGLGFRALAGGSAALLVLLLAEKSQLQGWLRRIGERELRATFRFAVLALVVLPLLPDGEYGPFDAFRPRQLWSVVLLFSGLNFAGYIARRIIGETRGLGVTGLLGGLVSSTAVTLNFSRRSREQDDVSVALALGVIAACTVLLPRIMGVVLVLAPSMAVPLLWYLAPPFVVGVTVIVVALLRERQARDGSRDAAHGGDAHTTGEAISGLGNPLGFWSSIQMAVAFQVVLFLVAWLRESVGRAGIVATAGVLGLTDMDALTVSMTELASDPSRVALASLAIAVGVLSNTALKAGLVVALGAPRFRIRAGGGLALLAAGSGIGLWLGS